jgi:hypothetical protein
MPKKEGSVGLRPVVNGFTLKFQAVEGSGKEAKVIGESGIWDISQYPKDIQDKMLMHGASTLSQQRVSQEKDWQAKFDAMGEYHELWYGGDWKAERTAGARCPSALIQVLINVYKAQGKSVTASDILTGWKQLDKDAQDKLKEKHKTAMEDEEKRVKAAPVLDLLND